MSKSKSLFWDQAESKFEEVCDGIEQGTLTQSQAIKEIRDSDLAWGLIGFNTVEDVIDAISEVKVFAGARFI
jgi:hypothetical protein|tara:strand:- start:24 stop:239 length:216 start_codon:yes stop_codon:yes gene_type:complete